MKLHTRLEDKVESQCLLNEHVSKLVIYILASIPVLLSPVFFLTFSIKNLA